MKNNLALVVGGTTFALFMTEALIHFNMGQNYKKTKEGKETKFELPDSKELIKLSLIDGVFSILNGVIVNEVKKSF